MVKQINNAFKLKKERNWEKIYFMFDLHGTILIPSYDNEEQYEFYPYSKEALRLMSNDPEIVMILWSCTSDEKLRTYNNFLKENGIHFDYINENPEIENNELSCFDKKIYCSVGFDDKFGFLPTLHWHEILEYFRNRRLNISDMIAKYKGTYHRYCDSGCLFIYDVISVVGPGVIKTNVYYVGLDKIVHEIMDIRLSLLEDSNRDSFLIGLSDIYDDILYVTTPN